MRRYGDVGFICRQRFLAPSLFHLLQADSVLKTKINPVQLHTLKGKPCALHISGLKRRGSVSYQWKWKRQQWKSLGWSREKGSSQDEALVHRIDARSPSLPSHLPPPTSQPKDFVDSLLSINPLATRQKVISTTFSKLRKPAAPLLL